MPATEEKKAESAVKIVRRYLEIASQFGYGKGTLLNLNGHVIEFDHLADLVRLVEASTMNPEEILEERKKLEAELKRLNRELEQKTLALQFVRGKLQGFALAVENIGVSMRSTGEKP